MPLLPGKLPPDLLAALIQDAPTAPDVILGPRVGEDAAILDFGERFLAVKTDPITFATDSIGWYAVQVNANDIATTGGTPRYFMITLLLPAGQADESLVGMIFDQVKAACCEHNIALIGGHTEITTGINRPLVAGCMIGEGPMDRLVHTGGAQPGDVLLLTKGYPIETVAILARDVVIAHDKGAALRNKFDEDFLHRCANFLYKPGISVARDAAIIMKIGGVHSMHDPTEGGLATGLWEVAEASGHTLQLKEMPPPLPEGEALCAAFGLDPLGCIASGALLCAVAPEKVGPIRDALAAEEIISYVLGEVREGTPEVLIPGGGRLLRPERDEIAKVFE